MNKIVQFFILMFVFFGCSSNVEYSDAKLVYKFSEAITLTGEKIHTEEHGVFQPFHIEFIDSLLVVSTLTDGKLISIYTSEGKFQSGFGRIGQGPNELNDSPEIYNYQMEDDIIVTSFDINLLTLDKINLYESINDTHMVFEETYEFPGYSRRVSSSFYLDSTRIIGVYEGQFYRNLDERTGLYVFDPSTGDFKTQKLPNIDFKSSDRSKPTYRHFVSRLNSRRFDLSPNNKYAAIIMRYVPLLQVYQVGEDSFEQLGNYYLGNELKSHKYEMDLFERNEYSSHYLDVTVSANNIYLLKNFNKAIGDEATETTIEVFSWDGVPIKTYRIPSKYDIDIITINERDSIVYALSYYQDTLYKFQLDKE